MGMGYSKQRTILDFDTNGQALPPVLDDVLLTSIIPYLGLSGLHAFSMVSRKSYMLTKRYKEKLIKEKKRRTHKTERQITQFRTW